MSRFKRSKAAILIVAAALLAGCATTSGPLSQVPVAPYSESIELNGKLVVNFEKDGKPDTVTGSFNWVQTPSGVDVTLASPLGQTIAVISLKPGSATLTQAGQAPRVASDIDGLTAQTLGWSLPVSGLRDWLQGYASTPGGARFAASPANNSVTTADGWRLSFVEWHDNGAAPASPKRIDAQRSASAATGPLSIRLVILPRS